jgi:hypothetical protein
MRVGMCRTPECERRPATWSNFCNVRELDALTYRYENAFVSFTLLTVHLDVCRVDACPNERDNHEHGTYCHGRKAAETRWLYYGPQQQAG